MSDRRIANVDMAAAWDGEEGASWAANAAYYEAAAARYDHHLLEHIEPGDDVLDIGCGNGGTTRAAGRKAHSALGLDLSSAMLAGARSRASEEGLTNVGFEQGDAQVYPFEPASFDVVISRFGAMFFSDPVAAFANLAGALRPDGRLALLAWQGLDQNDWIRATREALAFGRDLPTPPLGAPGPFGLADPDNNHRLLAAAGFEDIANEDVAEPLVFGSDLDDAYAFWSDTGPVRGMLADLDDATKQQGLANIRELLAAHATPEGIAFGSRAWLITARKP